jgi:tetratricopeptide (TPR) repeat protein
MAGVFEKLGDIDKAIEVYKKASLADYQNPAIHLGLASSYIKKNEPQKAIDELNLAIKFEPDSVEPHAVLALIYFSQDKIGEAGGEYEKALANASRLDPGNTTIYQRLGLLYLQQKNLNAAEKTYRLLLNLSPLDVDAHFYLGNVLDELKKREDAIKELKTALQLKPDYHQALNYLGYLYVEENRNLDEAEAMIKKALELEPENGAYIDSLGWLYFKRGKTKEAVRELEKAIALIEDPVIYDHLGDAYFKLKDFEKAKTNWELSLKLLPEQDKVKEKIKRIKKTDEKAFMSKEDTFKK